MGEPSNVKTDSDVDLTEIPAIQQKRIITFVNHFILTTVTYLNKLGQSCESRFMDFEYKMQKMEASLLILESQLASIPDSEIQNVEKVKTVTVEEKEDSSLPESKVNEEEIDTTNEIVTNTENSQKPEGPKASEHPVYARFFKMFKVGIDEKAVKLQMQVEGHNPSILDNPNAIIS